MIRTHGLNHISLSVKDPERSLAFYAALFGVHEYFRSDTCIQVLGPGRHDVLAFERREPAGPQGGVDHFGFRLVSPDEIEAAATQVEATGGKILDRGEHGPGAPYL